MSFVVPEHIQVRDKVGDRLAYLSPKSDGLKEVYVDRNLNEESTVDFKLPMTSDKWEHLTAECRVVAGDREFVILKPDAIDMERDDRGRVWGRLMGVESWKLLDRSFATVSNDVQVPDPPWGAVVILSGGGDIGDNPHEKGSAGFALYELLRDTEWTLGTVDVTGVRDLETEKESRLKNINRVRDLWGGYLVWEYVIDSSGAVTGRNLHFREEELWQEYNGFMVRYAKNIKKISKTVDNKIITKLYPFGESYLNIASVNDGNIFLEDYTYTNEVYEGTYMNQGIHTAVALKEMAERYLAKMHQPRYTYNVGMVDIRVLPGYTHESFELGHIVGIYDPEVTKEIFQQRIMRHRYNVFQPWMCELTIGEPEDRIEKKIQETFEGFDWVWDLLRYNANLLDLLKGFLDLEKLELEGLEMPAVDTYCEHIIADWNSNGFQFYYSQEYAEEPTVIKGTLMTDDVVADDPSSELDAVNFKVVTEHIRGDLIDPLVPDSHSYKGLIVHLKGASIPSNYTGKISIAAICTGVVLGEEI
jgi:hypothetical protein